METDFQNLLELAKSGVGLIKGTVSVAKDVSDMIESEPTVSPELQDLVAKLRKDLIASQNAQLALQGMIMGMQADAIERDRRAELKRDYEVFHTTDGAVVLREKAGNGGGQPVNYICPNCAEDGIRSFLQPNGVGKNCERCNTFYPFEPQGPIPGRVGKRNSGLF